MPTLVLLTVLAMTGCSDGSDPSGPTGPTGTPGSIVQGGAPGAGSTPLESLPAGDTDLVTEADYDFVRDMLQHHAQALEMTELVPERSAREDIPLLAERIALAQAEEIELMQGWLREQGQPVLDLESGGHQHGDTPMPGMLTATQLGELEAARGAAFDRLFLQFMYYHHQGALDMVAELGATDGGQDPFVFTLAADIDSEQRIEMTRIEWIQTELDGTTG